MYILKKEKITDNFYLFKGPYYINAVLLNTSRESSRGLIGNVFLTEKSTMAESKYVITTTFEESEKSQYLEYFL